MDSDSSIGSGGSWLTFFLSGFILIWSCGVLCMIIVALATRCCGYSGGTDYAHNVSAETRKKDIDMSLVTKRAKIHEHAHVIINNKSEEITMPQEVERCCEWETVDYAQALNSELFQQCGICLDSFQIDDVVSWSKFVYSCRHVYHQRCIETWLLENRHDDCPCCRGIIVRDDRERYKFSLCCRRCARKKYRSSHIREDEAVYVQQREVAQFCLIHGLILFPSCSNNIQVQV